MNRLILWLMRPITNMLVAQNNLILDALIELRGKLNEIEKSCVSELSQRIIQERYETCKVIEAVTVILRAESDVHAAHVTGRVAETVGVLQKAVLSLQNQQAPHLTLDLLRIWEAVTYSCNKLNADREARRLSAFEINRELIQWAKAYLSEQGWPDPGENVLEIFIEHRRKIDGHSAAIAELRLRMDKIPEETAALIATASKPVEAGIALFDRG